MIERTDGEQGVGKGCMLMFAMADVVVWLLAIPILAATGHFVAAGLVLALAMIAILATVILVRRRS